MKVRLSFSRYRFFVWIPYCLLLNRLAALVISGLLKQFGVSIRAKSVYAFIKSFKKELKKNKKLTVLQVDTASGFKLTVRL